MPYIRAPDGASVTYVDKLPDGYVDPVKPRNFGRRGKPLRPEYVKIRGYDEKIRNALEKQRIDKTEWAPFGAVHTSPGMLQIIKENEAREMLLAKTHKEKREPPPSQNLNRVVESNNRQAVKPSSPVAREVVVSYRRCLLPPLIPAAVANPVRRRQY
ncbi:hypothetical protein EDC01DRAFT_776909 [Geopyxis carbonaria]|nr:hypothetical protein EDC01DRAFT_776909 [Geopyxis carbonaria]